MIVQDYYQCLFDAVSDLQYVWSRRVREKGRKSYGVILTSSPSPCAFSCMYVHACACVSDSSRHSKSDYLSKKPERDSSARDAYHPVIHDVNGCR